MMGYQCEPSCAVVSTGKSSDFGGGGGGGGGAAGGPYTNGNGYDAPNYDYYLNPDQGQLRYDALMSPDQLQAEFGVSELEAIAMNNSLMHKPADKQMQFLDALRDFRESGIKNPTFDDLKASLVARGYNPNDPYQNTEITAWANWFSPGDLYTNLA